MRNLIETATDTLLEVFDPKRSLSKSETKGPRFQPEDLAYESLLRALETGPAPIPFPRSIVRMPMRERIELSMVKTAPKSIQTREAAKKLVSQVLDEHGEIVHFDDASRSDVRDDSVTSDGDQTTAGYSANFVYPGWVGTTVSRNDSIMLPETNGERLPWDDEDAQERIDEIVDSSYLNGKSEWLPWLIDLYSDQQVPTSLNEDLCKDRFPDFDELLDIYRGSLDPTYDEDGWLVDYEETVHSIPIGDLDDVIAMWFEMEWQRDAPPGYEAIYLKHADGRELEIRVEVSGSSFEGVEYDVRVLPFPRESGAPKERCIDEYDGIDKTIFILTDGLLGSEQNNSRRGGNA